MTTKTNQTQSQQNSLMRSMREPIEQLIHDVNSKCGSLKSAAGLLRTAKPAQAQELLGLMIEQAQDLAGIMTAYKKQWNGEK